MRKDDEKYNIKLFDFDEYTIYSNPYNFVLKNKKTRRYYTYLYQLFEKLYLIETDKKLIDYDPKTIYEQLKKRDEEFMGKIKNILGVIGNVESEDFYNKLIQNQNEKK